MCSLTTGDKAQVMAADWCSHYCSDGEVVSRYSGMYLDCEVQHVNGQVASARITTTCQATREMGIANKNVDGLPVRFMRTRPNPPYKRVAGKRKPTTASLEIHNDVDIATLLGDRPSPSGQHQSPKIRHIIRMALSSITPDPRFYCHWDALPEQLQRETLQEQIEDYVKFKLIETSEGAPRRLQYECRDKRLRDRLKLFLDVHHINEHYMAARSRVNTNVQQIKMEIERVKEQLLRTPPQGFLGQLEREKSSAEGQMMEMQIESGPRLKQLKEQRAHYVAALTRHLQEYGLIPACPEETGRHSGVSSGRNSAVSMRSSCSYSSNGHTTRSASEEHATARGPRVPRGQIGFRSERKFQTYDYVRFKDAKDRWGRVLPPKFGRAPAGPGRYELLMNSTAKVERDVPERLLELFSNEERCENMRYLHHELSRDVQRVQDFRIQNAEDYFKFHRYDMERLAFLGGVVDDFAVGCVVKIQNVRIPLHQMHLQNCFRYSDQPQDWNSVDHSWKKWYGETAKDLIKKGFPFENRNETQEDTHMPLDFTVVNGNLSQDPNWNWDYKLTVRVRLPADEKEALEKYQGSCRTQEIPYWCGGREYKCQMSDWQNGRIEKFKEIHDNARQSGARTAPLPRPYAEEWANHPTLNLLEVLRTRDQRAVAMQPGATQQIAAQPTAPASVPATESRAHSYNTPVVCYPQSTPRTSSTHLEVPGATLQTPRLSPTSPYFAAAAPPSPAGSNAPIAFVYPTGAPLVFQPPAGTIAFSSRPPSPMHAEGAQRQPGQAASPSGALYSQGDTVYLGGIPHTVTTVERGSNSLGGSPWTYSIQNMWSPNIQISGQPECSLAKPVGVFAATPTAATVATPTAGGAHSTPMWGHAISHGLYFPTAAPGIVPATNMGVSPFVAYNQPSAGAPLQTPTHLPAANLSLQFPTEMTPTAQTAQYFEQDEDEIVIDEAGLEMPEHHRETSAPDYDKYNNECAEASPARVTLKRRTSEMSAHAGDDSSSEGEEPAPVTPPGMVHG